jgi:ParB family chromosome partitioning protein
MGEEFRTLELAQIRESLTNPRRNFKGMEDLVASVTQHGVLVPLLVRPVNGHFEIIAGARRYRAAKEVGLLKIPVCVKNICEIEALEIQVIENLQREDVHPLEEAMGYERLLECPGYDVAAISVKVGRSESYVYQRMKLLDLIEPAREAFLADEITAGHAILIARLTTKDQERALAACFDEYRRDQSGKPILHGVRELSWWIHQNILLDLKKAIFNTNADNLAPDAKSCTLCPKRTGFAPALFPDIAHHDTCTDPECFETKTATHIHIKIEAAKEKTQALLELTTKCMGYGHKGKAGDPLPDEQWVRVKKQDRCEYTRKGIIVSGFRDRGQVLDVCATKDCKKHFNRGFARHERDPKDVAREMLEEAKKKVEMRIRKAIAGEILDQVRIPIERTFLELVVTSTWGRLWHDHKKQVVKAHGWEPEKKKGGYGADMETVILEPLRQMDDQAIWRFLAEISLLPIMDPPFSYGGEKKVDRLLELAGKLSINTKLIEERIPDKIIAEKLAKNPKKVQTRAKDSKKGKS